MLVKSFLLSVSMAVLGLCSAMNVAHAMQGDDDNHRRPLPKTNYEEVAEKIRKMMATQSHRYTVDSELATEPFDGQAVLNAARLNGQAVPAPAPQKKKAPQAKKKSAPKAKVHKVKNKSVRKVKKPHQNKKRGHKAKMTRPIKKRIAVKRSRKSIHHRRKK